MEFKKEILDKYPDHELSGRTKCVFKWLDKYYKRLLDAGCSYGYATRLYTIKCKEVYAVDIDFEMIEIAKTKYKNINFQVSELENLPFSDQFFDIIVLSDVLEHIKEPIKALNELYRILQIGGDIIITVPHKGLFAFLDPYNYGYYLKKHSPFFYRLLYKIIKGKKTQNGNEFGNPIHNIKHYHYSEKELFELIDKSAFANNYKIISKQKTGLILEPLALNVERLLQFFVKEPKLSLIMNPLRKLASFDYSISYSCASYNLAIKLKKIT